MIAFFEKRTIMSVSDVDMEEVDMPEITFCPGFRLGAVEAIGDSGIFGRRPNSLGRMTYFDYHSNSEQSRLYFVIKVKKSMFNIQKLKLPRKK